MQSTLYVLTGPTAVGKTEWALTWAERHNAEIVSCDSLLFYRGMDIGTAKPTTAERTRVRHHLVDICAVTDRMDVTRYVSLAREAVADILGRGRNVLVTGGSGFYLKTFFAPVADDIQVTPEIRQEVADLPLELALEKLRNLNPAGLGKLDLSNPRRVGRALERCLASGRQLLELAEAFARQPGPFSAFRVELTLLDRDPADLWRRIERRVAGMLRGGLVEEVARLRQEGLEQNPSAARAIGYREVMSMFKGELAVGVLGEEIARNTRALVKKQRTWFRTQLPPHLTLSAANLHEDSPLFGDAIG